MPEAAARRPMTAELWDRRYSKQGYAYGTEPNDFLREVATQLPDTGSALLLGEGEGRNAVFLAGRGLDCTALDISKAGLSKARRLAQERGVKVKTVAADLGDFHFGKGESWDVIVSIFCHLPGELRRQVHAAAAGALRPGGLIVLEAFTPEQPRYNTGGPPDEDRLVTLEMLREDFSGLEVVGRALEREVLEGSYHTGLSSVVQLLARKLQEPSVRYRRRVDQAFAQAQDVNQRVTELQDPFLSVAGHALHLTVKASEEVGQCRYCWLPEEDCICRETCDQVMSDVQWVLLCHPLEFLRSSSSGKLVASVLGGDFLVFGVQAHEERLEEVLAGEVLLLLPGDGSRTLAEWSDDAAPDTELTLLVLDGSWEQVQAMRDVIEARRRVMGRPPIPCLRLEEVGDFQSPLIDALKPGAGRGRLSTFEACSLFLREAEASRPIPESSWQAAMKGLDPMVRVLQRLLYLPPPVPEEHSEAVEALRAAARSAPLREGLRRCRVCGAAFSTPLRMREHLVGRRHCTAVAVHAREEGEGLADLSPEEASRIFTAYSTVPLSQSSPEPPDLALVRLRAQGLLQRRSHAASEEKFARRTVNVNAISLFNKDKEVLLEMRRVFLCSRLECERLLGASVVSRPLSTGLVGTVARSLEGTDDGRQDAQGLSAQGPSGPSQDNMKVLAPVPAPKAPSPPEAHRQLAALCVSQGYVLRFDGFESLPSGFRCVFRVQ
ncbi:unnamed protein product [Effrenium voratum]|uniref:tRNA-uridine aminocarboxypropyltransferase n=2 Tax=Effrenium voratum TaxID=2562239 RepID=A0AA36N5B8_9DINO|nr:unnamed protein product [Effrenium voratum]